MTFVVHKHFFDLKCYFHLQASLDEEKAGTIGQVILVLLIKNALEAKVCLVRNISPS